MRAWVEINLDNIEHNLNELKKIVKDKKILGVLKADAYGHGAVEVGKVLEKNGVELLAVACIKEAVELRKGDIKGEILIFGALLHESFKRAIKYDAQIPINSFENIEFLKTIKTKKKIKVQLVVETGMGRMGFEPEDAKIAIEELKKMENVEIMGIYSHLSSADDFDEDDFSMEQLEKFREFENYNFKYIHLLNSAGALKFNKKDFGTIVRPGITLYGNVPFSSELQKRFKTAYTLKSRVIFKKKLKEDRYISYNKTDKASKGDTVATLSIGYADGFFRAFSNKGTVKILGEECPILGRVCMDLTVVKLPECIADKVKLGEEVELIGEDIRKKSELIGTIPYEILTSTSLRLEKKYFYKGEYLKTKKLIKEEIDI